jgi:glutamyl-tRNA reductase
VAREATEHKRTLLVGAVEMGSGEMAVFDLTKAAQIYVANLTSNPARAEQMRGCYIEALLA